MAGEPGGEVQIAAGGVQAQDGVVVEGVHLVVARPRAGHAHGLERGHPFGQRRPDEGVERVVGDLQDRKSVV